MLKKCISFCLIVSQLGLSGAAFAANRPGEVTAERHLVQTVLTLKGLGLSDQELHQQIEGVLKEYETKAPAEGRDERLEQAFVDMRVLSPQQARTFINGAREMRANVAAQNLDTPEAQGQALQAQLELFARVNPVGAQFTACEWGWGVAGAGAIAALVGYNRAFDNPTCHDDLAHGYGCIKQRCYHTCTDADGFTYSCDCWDEWDTCYPTVCDVPGYYPHREQGRNIGIAGGVVAAVGVVILLKNRCI